MDHRRTISPAYYEKMAEAKAVFCSYCTLGAMLILGRLRGLQNTKDVSCSPEND